ncbi:trypsin-like serine protease [Hugenholtzia roseola]|uniref:trypsin-like serine protease n=1 Tax=Hugenholtzia roseola TaxID=1002 RepID=UPI00040DC077|nr:trypsin-like serine protease [Hugenholtzia roseola]
MHHFHSFFQKLFLFALLFTFGMAKIKAQDAPKTKKATVQLSKQQRFYANRLREALRQKQQADLAQFRAQALAQKQARNPFELPDDPSRIVGGRDAQAAEVPWQVALVGNGASNNYQAQFCGGTIIDPIWVLTAAHCLEGTNPQDIKIVAGVVSLTQDSGQERTVTQIIIHPNYNAATSENDIALLRLSSPLDLTDPNVMAVRYATPADSNAGLTDAGVMATISGWGNQSSTGQVSTPILQVAEVPIVSNQDANIAYQGAITEVMLAAGFLEEGGVDSCQGDSGGPLVVEDGAGNWIVAGVVSFGEGCALPDFPGIYARVSMFANWIAENLNSNPTTNNNLDLALLNVVDNLPFGGSFATCQGTLPELNAAVVVFNKGRNPITSATLSVRLGQTESSLSEVINRQVTFSPALEQGASVVVDLGVLGLSMGDNFAEMEIFAPNGSADQASQDNLLTKAYPVLEGYLVSVTFTFDRNGAGQNIWGIRDENTGEIVYVSNNSEPYNQTSGSITETVCLPAGDYGVYLFDFNGDGFQSSTAALQLSVPTQNGLLEIIRFTGSEFGSQAAGFFSLPFSGTLAADLAFASDALYACQESISVGVLLNNVGSLPIQSARIRVGENNYDFTNLFISSGNAQVLTIENVAATLPVQTISATLLQLNGTDVETDAATTTQVLRLAKPLELGVRLNADDYPEESGMLIFRALSGGEETPWATLTNFVEANAANERAVCIEEGTYRLMLFDSFQDGIESNNPLELFLPDAEKSVFARITEGSFEASTEISFKMLNTPSNLRFGAGNVLTWEDNAALESGYVVERSTQADRNFAPIATLAANTTTYTDANAPTGRLFYRVRATGENALSMPSNASENTVTGLANEKYAQLVSLFPNPTQDQVTIRLPEATVLEVQGAILTDLVGKTHFSFQVQELKQTLAIKGLEAGLYLLQIQTDKGLIVKKLMIQ